MIPAASAQPTTPRRVRGGHNRHSGQGEDHMEHRRILPVRASWIAGLSALGFAFAADPGSTGSGSGWSVFPAAQAAEDMPPEMLAAQIRTQGFACDKALEATRDAERSRPDHAVWVLKCGNATYRLSFAPDMAAKIEPLR